MANPEHLVILKQGVDVWNKWRKEDKTLKPDLSNHFFDLHYEGINLNDTNLSNAKLSVCNFEGSSLIEANLSGANIIDANFKNSDLRGANFSGTKFWIKGSKGANFSFANLYKANLDKSNLILTNFNGANLAKASLYKANLVGADLSKAILKEANLSNANLFKAKLIETILTKSILNNAIFKKAILFRANLQETSCMKCNFSEANLTDTNFYRSNLTEANFNFALLFQSTLCESNLVNSDLSMTNLTRANFSKSNLSGSCLYSSSRADWIINDVDCTHVFWDKSRQVRDPVDGEFEGYEFEKLYRSLPTIEYIFLDDFTIIDIIVMDHIVKEINNQNINYDLRLDSFHNRGKPRAIFTVRDKRQADDILNKIKVEFESKIKIIKTERDTYRKALSLALKEPRKVIKFIEMGDTYEISGQAGSVGRGAHAHDLNFNQVWNDIAKDVDLSKLSAELSILEAAIKREAKTSEDYRALAEVSDAEKAAKAGKGLKVVEHLKKAGKWAFDVATNIGTDVAAEVIKKSLGF